MFRRERELLIACVRYADPVIGRRFDQLLSSHLDWDEVMRRADDNGLAPMLHRAVASSPAGALVPGETRRMLERRYHFSAIRNARLFDDLRIVLAALSEAAIPVVLLKGAALTATSIWGEPALRPMADLDLLVPAGAIEGAERVLEALAYVADETGQSREQYRRRHHHLAPLIHPSGTCVEIHWDLFIPNERVSVDLERVWARVRPCRVAGTETFVLSPTDTVVHLCLHLASQTFADVPRGLADLVRVIDTVGADVDWSSVAEESIECGYARLLYHPLRIVRETFGVEVPPPLLERLRRGAGLGWLDDQILNWLGKAKLFKRDRHASTMVTWILGRVEQDLLLARTRVVWPGACARCLAAGLPRLARRTWRTMRPSRSRACASVEHLRTVE